MKKAKKEPAVERRPPMKKMMMQNMKTLGSEKGISEKTLLKPIAAGLK